MVAHTTRDANGSPTQTMTSGATATTGVTCSATAQGRIAARARRLDAIAAASPTPSRQAATSAAAVTARVEPSEASSSHGSARKARPIATGPGTM